MSNTAAGNFGPDTSYVANTNLEEISDWLTKIIVGLGLIDLKELPSQVKRVSEFFSQTCGSDFCGGLFLAIGAFFLVTGFVFSYFLSRVYLALAFGYSGLLGKFVVALTKETAEKQSQTSLTSVKAIALTNEARVLINSKSASDTELDKALSVLDEALSSDPTYVVAYIEKGRALKRKALLRAGPEREVLLKKALEVLAKARELQSNNSSAIYNTACYKALLGAPTQEILEDLSKAFALNQALKGVARNDPDFPESLRNTQAFQQLTEV